MTPADLATAVHEERMRRVAAWRPLIAQRKATIDKARADELLWFEIEMLARRYAGDREGTRYGYPSDFSALLRTAQATLAAAMRADAPAAKIDALWHLRNWLQNFAPIEAASLQIAA